jgi:hypothetical protein
MIRTREQLLASMGVDPFHYRQITTDTLTGDAIDHARKNISAIAADVYAETIEATTAQRETIANALLDCLERINETINVKEGA